MCKNIKAIIDNPLALVKYVDIIDIINNKDEICNVYSLKFFLIKKNQLVVCVCVNSSVKDTIKSRLREN